MHPVALLACSCAPVEDPRVALEKSSSVFVGRVIALEIVPSSEAEPGACIAFEDMIGTFVVSRQWKGISPAEGHEGTAPVTRQVRTAFTCCVCGFSFVLGETYLVYAVGDESALTTSICSRTIHIGQASEDLHELGEPLWSAKVPVMDGREAASDGF
jgi:hypothetical protein